MPDWHHYLNQSEQARLDQIDVALAALNDERRQLHNRAKQRKHRAG